MHIMISSLDQNVRLSVHVSDPEKVGYVKWKQGEMSRRESVTKGV
jgi:hypothetical protein